MKKNKNPKIVDMLFTGVGVLFVCARKHLQVESLEEEERTNNTNGGF